jgi:hypothetical protein
MVDLQIEKLPSKLSVYIRSISIILVLAIVFCLQGCKVSDKRGAATPDRIVEQYLLALENRNENLMQQLVLEDVNTTKDIRAKIIRFGGHKIQERQINYIKHKPILWNAEIKGFYLNAADNRKEFDDSIELEYQSKGQVKLYGGRWYLLLGNR